MKTIKIKHSGNLGDIIYSLNAVRSASILHDCKVVLLINLNQPIQLTPSYQHPLGGVMMNETMFKMAYPLLKTCDFIQDILPFNNQKIDYDFDKFRKLNFNLAAGDIKKWYLYAYPELREYFASYDDLDMPDIFGRFNQNKTDFKGIDEIQECIVINRTSRYQNPFIDYRILDKCDSRILFVGVEQEFNEFQKIIPSVTYIKVDNFLQMAQLIYQSYLFIGNQSMAFAIAEQFEATRLLEVAPACPNVITKGYEMFTQEGFEYCLKDLELI